MVGSWISSIKDGLLDGLTGYRPRACGPESLREVTVNIFRWKVDQTTTKRHKLTTETNYKWTQNDQKVGD